MDWDPCTSIHLDHLFNQTLINLTPHIRHPGDPHDSLLPFPSPFFCLQLVQILERIENGKAKVNHANHQDVLYKVSNL